MAYAIIEAQKAEENSNHKRIINKIL